MSKRLYTLGSIMLLLSVVLFPVMARIYQDVQSPQPSVVKASSVKLDRNRVLANQRHDEQLQQMEEDPILSH